MASQVKTSASCCDCSCGSTTAAAAGKPARIRYRIENMDCPTEEALIRDRLGRIPEISNLEFDLMNRTLTVHHSLASTEPLEAALSSIGMQARREEPAAACSTTLHIAQMDCATEEGLIRGKLRDIPGISALEFNLVQRTLVLQHDEAALPGALAAIKSLGFDAQPQSIQAESVHEATPAQRKSPWGMLALSAAAALAAELLEWSGAGADWMVIGFALIAIFTGGLPTYKKGWIALRNRNLNMNALMSIAVTGAMLIGRWPEAAMVMFLFALAEVIEARSLDRARNAIRGLMELAPEETTVRQDDGSWQSVPARTVGIGAIARVRPGERIALDGEVTSGRSTVNQAPITGESLPVDKAPGDPVFAGTINDSGSFEYRVTAPATQSTLARIIHAVEAAQGARAPTQRFVDSFARVYTPAVFVIAIAMAVVPPIAWGLPWLEAVYRALVLLVIACPCALVISTPVTIVSGLASAARHGILVKGGVYLEEGRKLAVVALDKTGTVTYGMPAQTDFEAFVDTATGELRSYAASLAARSDHPVSLAVARAATEAGIALKEVEEFNAIPGRGVQGVIDGRAFVLGNHRLISEQGLSNAALDARLTALERQGKSVVVLAAGGQALALFAVADTVKETSRAAIADLHALGVRTVMLSGDNPHTAESIAAQVGVDETRGNLLPTDKLAAIESMLGSNGKVGMVGDGINDAPALARADIGFAMGAAGTDAAIETADVALMDDDLRKIPHFIRLSRSTASILTQNIVLALGIKAIFVVLAFLGQATMWMAVFADMGASLLVVFNGLRLLRR